MCWTRLGSAQPDARRCNVSNAVRAKGMAIVGSNVFDQRSMCRHKQLYVYLWCYLRHGGRGVGSRRLPKRSRATPIASRLIIVDAIPNTTDISRPSFHKGQFNTKHDQRLKHCINFKTLRDSHSIFSHTPTTNQQAIMPILHIVLFEFKPSTTHAQVEDVCLIVQYT